MVEIKKVIETEGTYRGRKFYGRYSRRIAFVKIGSYWTYAEWNPHHSNWVAGDAYAPSPVAAVMYSTYKALPRRKSITALIDDFLFPA